MSDPTRVTPTAEEILVQTTGTMREFTGIEQHLAQRLADALAEVERLTRAVGLWTDRWNNAAEETSHVLRERDELRQRAEAAEATLEAVRANVDGAVSACAEFGLNADDYGGTETLASCVMKLGQRAKAAEAEVERCHSLMRQADMRLDEGVSLARCRREGVDL